MRQAPTPTELSRTAVWLQRAHRMTAEPASTFASDAASRCEGCRSPHAFWEATAMITIREETFRDVEPREALLDACFGPARFQKTCERLREGRMPAEGLSLVIDRNGEVIGTVRLWHVCAGPDRPALMLGPIAIDPSVQSLGLGAKLMREALKRASQLGHEAVLLVGDAPYYERFGFSTEKTGSLWLPGPY